MASQNYLAFDLGAESGRGILGAFDGDRLTLEEVGRFATGRGQDDIGPDGVRRWDIGRIGSEIEALLGRAQAQAGTLHGVGVDTWGVDFGLLDAQGRLLEAPVHYRDERHPPAMTEVHSLVAPEEIWAKTGVQFLPFNTLYQLYALQTRRPGLLDRAAHLLLMPDLFHHQLTGGRSLANERTEASTTQLFNPATRDWEPSLLTRLGLPSHFLGEIVPAGTRVGETVEGVPVYAPGSHDTASAVAATPAAPGSRWAFLSSGTWSLLGVELTAPNLTAEARELGFSNEFGVGETIRFLKNIMGLWLVQECRRSLKQTEGRDYSYAELTALAESAPSGGPLVDATAHRFLAPPDMAQEIRAACAESGQPAPQDAGALIRCCLDSLAHAYRQALDGLEHLLGTKFDALHIVGGGSQNRLLNQLTADACGIPVVAGPSEATAIGNVLAQLVASGAVADWAQARALARHSFPTETFTPR
jgi:rhamnulokinase